MTENSTATLVPDPGTTAPRLHWPLVSGIAALALLHPLAQLTGLSALLGDGPTAFLIAVVVGGAWTLVVGLSDAPRPFATSVVAALLDCAVFAVIVVVAALDSADDSAAWGIPVGVLLVSVVQVVFGLACGGLAVLVRSARDARS